MPSWRELVRKRGEGTQGAAFRGTLLEKAVLLGGDRGLRA